MRCVLVILTSLFVFTASSPASEPTPEQKQRIEVLKKQLAEKRLEVAKIEAELAKLEPVVIVPHLYASNLKVGTAGPFGATFVQNGRQLDPSTVSTFNVVKVIDDKRMIVKVLVLTEVVRGVANDSYGELILVTPTKGIADGGLVTPDSSAFRITGTEKYGDKTYFTVEPYTLPKK